ncbi:14 kDa subunit of cytochrome bd ubiquinol oxidase [Macrolepiota fuliginosa MF-IS2]|uniref:Cytochrome b-c1 complex subunit 7 n=1 Tax=Macrolepiota fuliginosa MF-IS2 TaxID=1400762 RepID=A0A9P6C4E5_9AGAR|nr:14 kDa subunit of cytochrome bd ubiquinol oxidase [Macrolepiota fuliginosa MF-IS2]
MFGPLGFSLAPYIQSSKTLTSWVKPLANWYANAAGYRQYGFKYDDLLVEENEPVQKALSRLTPREHYDRAFRLKRASQASILHKPLEKNEWTPAAEDVRYLKPHVLEVMKEDAERHKWDTVVVEKK